MRAETPPKPRGSTSTSRHYYTLLQAHFARTFSCVCFNFAAHGAADRAAAPPAHTAMTVRACRQWQTKRPGQPSGALDVRRVSPARSQARRSPQPFPPWARRWAPRWGPRSALRWALQWELRSAPRWAQASVWPWGAGWRRGRPWAWARRSRRAPAWGTHRARRNCRPFRPCRPG